jgi:Ricin-type beta-trefoil lectin domain-like
LKRVGTVFLVGSHLAAFGPATGLALGAPATAAGHPVAPRAVSGQITPDYSSLYDYGSGLCLSVPRSASAAGAQLRQRHCINDKHVAWAPVGGFSGQDYFIRNDSSQQCLSVRGDSTHSGAAIVQEPCHPGKPPEAQRFVVIRAGIAQGYAWELFQSVRSGYCLTVPGGSAAHGGQVELGSCTTRRSWFILLRPGAPLPARPRA